MAAPETAPYPYRPLSDSEIRVLHVEECASSDGPTAPIRCRLVHVKLSDQPSYVALSYVWGDPRVTSPVLIDGIPFQVTTNLHGALEEYRREMLVRADDPGRPSLPLWADAVCINQADLREKALQIPRMGDIYSSCYRVFAWLPGWPSSPDRQAKINDLFDVVRVAVDYGAKAQRGTWKVVGSAFAEYLRGILNTLDIEALERTVGEMGNNPWFGRAWIAQEVALPKEPPLLVFGPNRYDFLGFAAVWQAVRHHRDSWYAKPDPGFGGPETYSVARVYYGDPDIGHSGRQVSNAEVRCGFDLLAHLVHTAELRATVDHDIFYSVLGMVDTSVLPESLLPDYGLSFPLVAHRFTAFILLKTGNPGILNMGRCGRMPGVPSWVPDPRARIPMELPDEDCPGVAILSPDHGLLKAEGVTLGRCVAVFPRQSPLPDTATGGSSAPIFKQFESIILRESAERQGRPLDIILEHWLERGYWSLDDSQPSDMALSSILSDVLGDPMGRSGANVAKYREGIVWGFKFHNLLFQQSQFVLEDGKMGYCRSDEANAQEGDVVAVLKGCTKVFVLRLDSQLGHSYKIISECSLDGDAGRTTYGETYFLLRTLQSFSLV